MNPYTYTGYAKNDFLLSDSTGRTNTIDAYSMIFTGNTPANASTITGNNFAPQLEITSCSANTDLETFTYTFSGITYPYYDSGVLLMMNFDKVASLNETDGMIKDFSQYDNYGSGYNGITRTGNGRR